MVTSIPNEVSQRRVQAGTETVRGTAVVPTTRWTGDLSISATRPLLRTEETTGGYDRMLTPRLGNPDVSGTYAQGLTYEDFAILTRYGVKGGGTGVTDGQATPGYTYRRQPTFDVDDLDSATLEYGVPGMVWQSTGVMHDEFTISGDRDDADADWKWSSNLFVRGKDDKAPTNGTATGGSATTITQTGAAWTVNAFAGTYVRLTGGAGVGQVRKIASNTADTLTLAAPVLSPVAAAGTVFTIEGAFTPAITLPTRESVAFPGTKLYLDAEGGTIGTTQVLGRFISFSVTWTNNYQKKWFAENVTEASSRTGRGSRMISGQVRMEFDRRTEYEQWEALTGAKMRIEQTGSVINVSPETRKLARIDVPRLRWDAVTEDEREANITATFAFLAYMDTVAGYPAAVESKIALATLP
jgi:hypothetical protein